MKKKIISILLVFILIVLIGAYSFVDKKYPVYDPDIPTEEYVLSGTLENGEESTQTFQTEAEAIDGISIKVVVNGDNATGQLFYALCDEDNTELLRESVSIEELKSDNFNVLRFERYDLNKDEQYTLKLRNESDSGLSFYITPSSNINGALTVDDIQESGTMVLRILKHKFDVETFIVVLFFAVYIYFFIRMLYRFFLK